jgi:hypothetical protein
MAEANDTTRWKSKEDIVGGRFRFAGKEWGLLVVRGHAAIAGLHSCQTDCLWRRRCKSEELPFLPSFVFPLISDCTSVRL